MPAGITFPINSYEVQPQFHDTLDQVAQTLTSYSSTLIDVYGHTDPSGGDAINLPLSRNRAQAVANYLAGRGVQPARIATQGFGSSQPLAGNDNSSEAERSANRRVEIRIVPVSRRILKFYLPPISGEGTMRSMVGGPAGPGAPPRTS